MLRGVLAGYPGAPSSGGHRGSESRSPAESGGVLLVTGGGRGIGAATAVLASRRGYRVAVNFVRDDVAAQAVVEAISAAGGDAIAVQADVGRQDEVIRLFETIDERLGTISALVNNAGVLETQCRVEDLDEDRLLRILRTNVLGDGPAVARSRTAHVDGPWWPRRRDRQPVERRVEDRLAGEYVDYAASKAAVDTFTRGLALEVAGEGIRVNAVRPGDHRDRDPRQRRRAGRAAQVGELVAPGPSGTPGRGRGGHRVAAVRGRVVRDRHGP